MSLFTRAIRAAAAVLLTGSALAVATPALADALVVRSTGPSAATYRVGQRLPTTARVVLRGGDRVVLVGEGGTRTLTGPGSFPVRAPNIANQGNRATLERYISTGGGTISRTGAVRGATGDDRPRAPNLWVVDISQGGTFCVTDPATLTLWRGDMSVDTLLTLESVDTPPANASLAFVAGQNFRAWPEIAMPYAEGRRYRISGPGLTVPTEVTFVTVGTPAADPGEVATMLADRGCLSQLAQLGERIDEASGG